MDYARAEGRAEALSNEIGQNKELMKQMMQAHKKTYSHKYSGWSIRVANTIRKLTLENMQEKQDAEVKARRLQDEVDEQRKARTLAETHARTLSTTLEQEEEALRGAQESGGNLAARYADLTLCIYVCVYIHICMYVGGCICPRRRSRPKAGHAKGESRPREG